MDQNAMSYLKGIKSNADGNRRLLKEYGGSPGSGPTGRQHYARGGAVKAFAHGGRTGENPSLAEGMGAAPLARASMGKHGKGKPGKGKKAPSVAINIIHAGQQPGGAPPPALGPPMGAKPDGPPPGPPPGPPMPPPGPGGPPRPMAAAKRGRIRNLAKLGKYAHVGRRIDGTMPDPPPADDAASTRQKPAGHDEHVGGPDAAKSE